MFAPAHAADGAAEVVFHAASGLDAAAVLQVQARVRHRVLRAFVCRGLLAPCDREEMGRWAHGGGFSLDAAVRIAGADRAGRERLLRYCARPPFALDHLHQHDAEHLVYDIPKPRPDGPRALVLTPLDLTCPFCHAAMRTIAFSTAPSTVRRMLEHLGAPTRPPRGAPARGPPLWEAVAAAPPAGNAPRWEQAAQPLPEIDFDQRLTW